MLELVCTRKLASRIKKPFVKSPSGDDFSISTWYADIYNFERRNTVIVTHPVYKFSIVLWGFVRADFDVIGKIVLASILHTLEEYDVDRDRLHRFYEINRDCFCSYSTSRYGTAAINKVVEAASWYLPVMFVYDSYQKPVIDMINNKYLFGGKLLKDATGKDSYYYPGKVFVKYFNTTEELSAGTS